MALESRENSNTRMPKKPPPAAEPPRQIFNPTRIRAWRKFRKMTLEKLGGKVGLTASALSMLERGERGYTQETIEAIAKALGTDVPSLLVLDPGRPETVWSWLASIGQKETFRPE